MNILAIDIETIPNPDMLSKLPDVKPSATLKDLEKIKADIEKKKAEQIEKMALSPLYGKIACIGYYGEDIQKVDMTDEATMIKSLLKLYGKYTFITWNGKAFDFDFIIKRGIMLGICKLQDLETYTDKYKCSCHIDLMEKFCGYGKYLSLDEIANVMLDEKKIDFDVKQIPELIKRYSGREKIKEYCLRDCELTYRLAKKFGY